MWIVHLKIVKIKLWLKEFVTLLKFGEKKKKKKNQTVDNLENFRNRPLVKKTNVNRSTLQMWTTHAIIITYFSADDDGGGG